ncbi:hypothetical protein FHS37_006251 [Streptomyces griseostramineus]|uniref:Uncharacterized protein n=1 Tax=Streptomyces griseomycini TaxID=66895 RepID=A0A7W7V9Q8_9ACTN|nr:hypothetical protein [Streptomyces griseomycini]
MPAQRRTSTTHVDARTLPEGSYPPWSPARRARVAARSRLPGAPGPRVPSARRTPGHGIGTSVPGQYGIPRAARPRARPRPPGRRDAGRRSGPPHGGVCHGPGAAASATGAAGARRTRAEPSRTRPRRGLRLPHQGGAGHRRGNPPPPCGRPPGSGPAPRRPACPGNAHRAQSCGTVIRCQPPEVRPDPRAPARQPTRAQSVSRSGSAACPGAPTSPVRAGGWGGRPPRTALSRHRPPTERVGPSAPQRCV